MGEGHAAQHLPLQCCMSTSLYDTRNPGVSATVNAGFVLQLSRVRHPGGQVDPRNAQLGNSRCVATAVPREHVVVLAGVARAQYAPAPEGPARMPVRHGEDYPLPMM